ncbi:hypothetical protein CDIK_1178 [Cucumispora dikerogammari]|nr:hypothetical protein CDIK_1178 [Cucumispora dikerogammari]
MAYKVENLDNMTSNYAEARDYCTECKSQSGKLKTVQIDLPGEGRFMLLATSCDNCPNKSSQMLPMTQLEVKTIEIRGVINTLEDLYRYIYISGGTRVVFFIETFIYEFGCSNDIVGTIETLLFNAVNDIASAYEFARYTTNTGSEATEVRDLNQSSSIDSKPEPPSDNETDLINKSPQWNDTESNAVYSTTTQSSERLESKLQLVSSSEDLTDRGKVKCLLQTLKKHMVNPDFIIEVTDEQGTSRVCPRNKMMGDCKFDDLSTYNDEHITHRIIE